MPVSASEQPVQPVQVAVPVLERTEAVVRVREGYLPCRLKFSWLGEKRALTKEQRGTAAQSFNADGARLSAGKTILDTKDPIYQEVTKVRTRAKEYWHSITLPFPEDGIRLLQRADIEKFDAQMNGFREELADAVIRLQDSYNRLKEDARSKLGQLFNEADYPTTLVGLFTLTTDYPSVAPSNLLQELSPVIYERECQKVSARFQQAVDLAETAFMQEFSKVVTNLTSRIAGEGRVFRDTTVTNLTDFFARFAHLNVNSNPALDELIGRAQAIVGGIAPQDIRDNKSIREQVSRQMQEVQTTIDSLMERGPVRNLLRSPSPNPAVIPAPLGDVSTSDSDDSADDESDAEPVSQTNPSSAAA